MSEGELHDLTREECVALLGTSVVGRLAVVDAQGRHPLVFPVNYALDGEAIVFRTGPGTKLDLAHGRFVAFEVDAVDVHRREGWSVLVQGIAEEIPPDELAEVMSRVTPEPFAPGEKEHWVRVLPTFVTGRRITPADIPFPLHPRGYL